MIPVEWSTSIFEVCSVPWHWANCQ